MHEHIEPEMLIDVALPGATEITRMRKMDLLQLQGGFENDREIVQWVQYHLPACGSMVHRSAHVHLKEGIFIGAAIGEE
jgi:hypothetical protein